ncbi:MAG TPA: dicarboxylate/amino acid:cation symporter [Acidobacteria bacterium]|nr:dicarboxylate/amino acid:cation symporter [Acidobacteriota bacterium]MQG57516.1 dicarboxylate/amino acid:cation symporter [SAR202 cluster bacterium]HAK57288.1 dicarboxylate/amino acid:cation symporter [Acidobacteriota bacterium]
MSWYRQTHWRILIALGLGLVYGVIATLSGWGTFTTNWIAPFGTIFLRLLLLIAVPLVLASLITGVASLADLQKLSRIGGKTIGIYIGTTLVALVIGLSVVNLIRPGESIPDGLRERLQATYQGDVADREQAAAQAAARGPLQPLVDMVPDNFVGSASSNRNMLNMVFVAFLVGTALILIPKEKAKPLLDLCESVNEVIIKIVELVIRFAPIGVFALIADTVTGVAGDSPGELAQLLGALGLYCLCVLLGMTIHMLVTYPALLKLRTPLKLRHFFPGIVPAQLVAFSTSSSAATLPVTMKNAEQNLGVSEEVASFVLPLGATINMDGTALYQAVAAVFIAQTLGIALDLQAQLTIVFMALLASIGTAAVPSAGVVMLVIILEAIGVPIAGIALILGVDRFLDMCRTAANVTGDATVAAVVAASENQLFPTPMNRLGEAADLPGGPGRPPTID